MEHFVEKEMKQFILFQSKEKLVNCQDMIKLTCLDSPEECS